MRTHIKELACWAAAVMAAYAPKSIRLKLLEPDEKDRGHCRSINATRHQTLPCRSTITELKSRQRKEENPFLGVDCLQSGQSDMKTQNVIEALSSKREQIQLATQVVRMILKVDDVRVPDDTMRGYPQ